MGSAHWFLALRRADNHIQTLFLPQTSEPYTSDVEASEQVAIAKMNERLGNHMVEPELVLRFDVVKKPAVCSVFVTSGFEREVDLNHMVIWQQTSYRMVVIPFTVRSYESVYENHREAFKEAVRKLASIDRHFVQNHLELMDHLFPQA